MRCAVSAPASAAPILIATRNITRFEKNLSCFCGAANEFGDASCTVPRVILELIVVLMALAFF